MTPDRSNGSTERVFIALEVPRLVREELTAWLRTAAIGPGTRPVEASRMHLTLCFLGEREPREIALAEQAMAEAARPLDPVRTGAPVWLPQRRPRALAIEVRDESGELGRLRSELGRSLTETIAWDESRAFRPHLTVARFGRGARIKRTELPPTPSIGYQPEAITLYSSTLDPDGAIYKPLATTDLPNPAAA